MRVSLKVFSDRFGVASIELEAASLVEAEAQAHSQGHVVLSAERSGGGLVLPRRTRRFPLLQFSQQLQALLAAGLNVAEAVESLAENESAPEVRAVIRDLLARLQTGQSCSTAMAGQPQAFPAFYVAAIRATERSGGLEEALRRYVAYQTQIDAVRKKAVAALIYPALLVVVGGLVTLFLLTYVVPKFSRIFDARNVDLPWLSQLLMSWGAAVSEHGWALAAAGGGALGAGVWLVSRPALRRRLMAGLWALPWLGERLRIYQLARFYRTLGMLLRGGMAAPAALDLAAGLLDPLLRGRAQRAGELVREGKALSAAFFACGLTTPVAHRMLRTGEHSGRSGEMLDRVAAFFDDEVARWLDVFAKVFEPAMMTLIGFMVGGIVVLMYLPIFDLAGSLQ
ncbi:MAG: type II secretion system F family protein [Rhodocyclales bacterium]|nr:type II secretion system F family protein [Rhodocyclales bacterium]